MDILAESHGNIFFLLRSLTQAASNWIEEMVSEDRQCFGNALVVEPRYIGDLAKGVRADGLAMIP